MQKITLEQASVGMKLGNDVAGADGNLLASTDSIVDEAMLRRLMFAGVAQIVVQGKPVPGADMGYNARARLGRLEYLFRAHRGDRFMMALRTTLFKHFQERM